MLGAETGNRIHEGCPEFWWETYGGWQRVYAWRVIRANICSWRVKVTWKETGFVNNWMHVTRDLSHEVCVIREWLVFGLENFVFLKFFRLDKSSTLTSCADGLVTVSDLWDVSAYIKSTVLSVQEIWNYKKVTNLATGHSSIKNSKACTSRGEGAQETED